MGCRDDSGACSAWVTSRSTLIYSISSELYHIHGCFAVTHACKRPVASHPSRPHDKLRAIQSKQGVGGSESDGVLVRILMVATSSALIATFKAHHSECDESFRRNHRRTVSAGSCAPLLTISIYSNRPSSFSLMLNMPMLNSSAV